MRTEIPAFQRCCICLPLRYGLIVWGYLRIPLAALLLVTICFDLNEYSQLLKSEEEKYKVFISDIVISCLTVLVLIADIILGIIFIVGCHKKNVSLIEKYYYHSLLLLALLIPLGLYNFCRTWSSIIKSSMPLINKFYLTTPELIASLSYAFIQIYIVLLVRSEILKLNSDYQFRFENKVTEAECFLNIDDTIEEEVKVNHMKDIKSIDDDD